MSDRAQYANVMGTGMHARGSRALAVIVGLAAIASVTFGASPADGAPVSGCSGQAVSTDSHGRTLDKATAPGLGGTADDPFHVDVNGRISWRGSTDGVLRNGTYAVKASGFTVASGKFENAQGNRAWAGNEDVGKRLDSIPVLGWLTKTLKPTATLKVDYTVVGQAGTCRGSVVLKIGDDPLFTPIWVFAVAMFLIAFWLLFWPRGFLGG